MMLQILLAEDHNIVRNGIRKLLELDETIHIVGEAINGLEVLEFIARQIHIDVVLADINMPHLDGISLIGELKRVSPATRIVLLSMHDSEKYITQAFIEGAQGYLLKNVGAAELIFALKRVHCGGKYMCSELSMRMFDKLMKNGHQSLSSQQPDLDFSKSEMDVLNLIAAGFTNNEISDKLTISKRTIEGYRQSLIDKTGSRNTASLVRFAVASGLIH